MINETLLADLEARLLKAPRFPLAQLPTPLQRLEKFGALLGGPDLWIKRDDLSGLAGGGNKTRKDEMRPASLRLGQGRPPLITGMSATFC